MTPWKFYWRTSLASFLFCGILGVVVTHAQTPSNYLVCFSNERSGDVTVLDGATGKVAATIPAGKRPRGIHASADGKYVFVALSGRPITTPRHGGGGGVDDDDDKVKSDHSADGIGVIDLAQRKLVRKLVAGSDPEQFAVSPNGKKLYISNEDSGTVSVVDAADGKLQQSIPVAEEPEGIAISPDGKFVYNTCETKGEVFVIDAGQNKVVKQCKVGGRPRNVVFLPDGTKAFVPSESTGLLHVLDTSLARVIEDISLPTNSRPMGLALTRDGSRLFVTTGWAATVCEIDTATHQLLNTIKVGSRPWGIALSPDERLLYVANGPSNDISIVDVQAGKETARIKAGSGPWGVVVVPQPAS